MTHRENGLVMVDEVENGIFHARQRSFSRALLELARAYQTQLILTTHSEEWLERFIEAAAEDVGDIAFGDWNAPKIIRQLCDDSPYRNFNLEWLPVKCGEVEAVSAKPS
jgi:predicted ATPase